MARITASVFTSHVPAIGVALDQGKTQEAYWKPLFQGYGYSRQWMRDNTPDVIFLIYNDHATAFSLDLIPTFAIGTEINMVNRLAAQYPQHTIFCLDPVICPCSTMYRIHPGYLAWVLEELVAGRVVNRIEVPADVADPARVALERMLAARP